MPAARLTAEFREPVTGLWLGRDAHLVHYPVKAGTMVNIVAIVRETGVSRAGPRPASPPNLRAASRASRREARALIAMADRWQKWALFDRAPRRIRAQGPVTLIGDAAHPMLPFLAQGGAMAIEDAAVLAHCLARDEDAAQALRAYERARHRRVARVQREARRNSWRYHLSGPPVSRATSRCARSGGERLCTAMTGSMAGRTSRRARPGMNSM